VDAIAFPLPGIQCNIKTRLRAFSIHFTFSALAFFAVLYLILLQWYPKPHFIVNGGWQGIRIMLCVDFVMGPFMTLILFNPAKSFRAILFDLTCIVILQISAFSWGVYAVHSQRPVGLSLSGGVIYPILEEELSIQEKSPADLQSMDDGMPPVVFARAAVTEDEQVGVVTWDFMEGIPEAKLFFLLDPVKDHIDKIFQASLENTQPTPEMFPAIRKSYLRERDYREGDLAFVPFEGRYGYSLLIFNRNGNIVDAIPDPRHQD
jgi:hypothetical protein